MDTIPRTTVGGVSVSRLIIGTNWFLGWSHTSVAKDTLIKASHTRASISDAISVFLEYGIDTVIGPVHPLLSEALSDAENRSGRAILRIYTPAFNILPGGPPEKEPERVFDLCKEAGAVFCMPHQCVTDVLLDRMHGVIRDIGRYTALIRERGMIPGLSTHMPETVVIADKTGVDVETYLQIYNAAGFLMQVEADWIMRVITNAKKPVITIKPLAAGKLLPTVGLAFVWNTIRDCDMVAVGTSSSDEAREICELSLDFLDRRIPNHELQRTRSKKSLE
jgi:hypothetical protein